MSMKTVLVPAAVISAVAAMLALGAAEPAFAAAAKAKRCDGLYQAYQNGECVNNAYINPDRVPNPCGGGVCYRSGVKIHKKNKAHQSAKLD
jgi:hypothetical protein